MMRGLRDITILRINLKNENLVKVYRTIYSADKFNKPHILDGYFKINIVVQRQKFCDKEYP